MNSPVKKLPALLLGLLLAPLAAAAALTPGNLRCEYAVNPPGVDSPQPRLFWQLTSRQPDQRQSACEILVASSEKSLSRDRGDLWDSGKVASAETIQIHYGGKTLASAEQVFWKVRVWDQAGHASAWSAPATWTMGVLQPADWHAQWIGAADTNISSLLLRREFVVRPGLKRALVNICGLGQYVMTLNGRKVGDDFLAPGWSKYNKTCLYDTRDITGDLRRGTNAVGVALGNGMYRVLGDGRYTKFKGAFGPQTVIAQIRLEYADGTVDYVGTDDSWRTSAGPVTFNMIYGGEDFDARRIQKGWDGPGFDDAQWQSAVILSGPGGALRGLSCAAPPIREYQIHPPVATHPLTNGDVVYDLGQNAAHVPRITVTGPVGSRIRIIPSELLHPDGSADQSSMGGGQRGWVWCEYTKGTAGRETWAPEFFYVGCRYLQVHLTPATTNGPPPKVKSIAGIVVHSASDPVGQFECSNDLFNRVFRLVRWAQQNNMVSVLTDCPHRERLGWLEQDHLNGPALRYDFGLARLLTKIINDIADSQLTNGLVPTTAPEFAVFRGKNDPEWRRNIFGDSPAWSSTLIIAPWQQYQFDGDLSLFRTHYATMTNYIAYLGSRATNYIVNYGLGDWYDLGPKRPGVAQLTPVALTATAFYFEDAKIMARAAALLGREADAKKYAELAGRIRAAFNENFYNPVNRSYATDSQCANAIPLVMGLCEPTNRPAVLDAIVRDVRARGNGLTAGDVGYRYLLRALADGGRNDVIFDMNNQTNHPGYGLQIAQGKTSLTEAWNGTFSQDHFMLGQIQEWFYHDLAGIQPGAPGFKKIIIAPHPVGDLQWVKADYDSIQGKIASHWRRSNGKFTLQITIPANTTATVRVPAQSAGEVEAPADARFQRMEDGGAVYETGSGQYEFTVRGLAR